MVMVLVAVAETAFVASGMLSSASDTRAVAFQVAAVPVLVEMTNIADRVAAGITIRVVGLARPGAVGSMADPSLSRRGNHRFGWRLR